MQNEILKIESQTMMKVSELNQLLNLGRMYGSKIGVYTFSPICIGFSYYNYG